RVFRVPGRAVRTIRSVRSAVLWGSPPRRPGRPRPWADAIPGRASTALRAIGDRKSVKATVRPVRVPGRCVRRDPGSREFRALNDSAHAAAGISGPAGATTQTLTVRAAGSRDPIPWSPRTATILCMDSAVATVRRATVDGVAPLPVPDVQPLLCPAIS